VNEIKIFVSSTFDKEMSEKRDLFRNKITLTLNSILGETIGNVYLRDFELGIPQNTSLVKVLDYCFDSLKSSDYFIGIIGMLYGTSKIKKHINNDELRNSEFKELIEYGIAKDLSVLDMEMSYAIALKKKSLILVDNKLLAGAESGVNDILKKFEGKEHVEIIYGDYLNIEAEVEKYFIQEISKEHNEALKISLEEKVNNVLMSNRLRYFVEDERLSSEIEDYIVHNRNKVLVIQGEKGVGKSTLLSWWKLNNKFKKTHKIICEFIGASETMVVPVFRSILIQLFEGQEDLVDEIKKIRKQEELINNFSYYLGLLDRTNEYIIVLDGIDFLGITITKYKEYWLPRFLPDNVRMIVSTRNALSSSDYEYINVKGINFEKFAHRIMELEGKGIEFSNNNLFSKMVKRKINPLIGRLIVSEILSNAKFDSVDNILEEYMQLFLEVSVDKRTMLIVNKFIDRLEVYYGRENVEILLTCLCCFNDGVSIDMLNRIFGDHEFEKLYYAVYPTLVINDSNRLKYYSSVVKEIIEKRYNDKIKDVRTALINYLEQKRELEQEEVVEIAKQYYLLKDRTKIMYLLKNLEIVKKLFKYNYYFVRSLVLTLKANEREDVLNHLDECGYDTDIKEMNIIAFIFESSGRIVKAIDLYKNCLELLESENNIVGMNLINNIARCYLINANLKQSLEYNLKVIKIKEESLNSRAWSLSKSYIKVAGILNKLGEYSESIKFSGKAMTTLKSHYSNNHYLILYCYNDLAVSKKHLGYIEETRELYDKILRLGKETYGDNHIELAIIYNNIGTFLRSKNDYKKGIEFFRKSIEIRKQFYGDNHISIVRSYNNLAKGFLDWNKPSLAQKYYEKSLSILKVVVGELYYKHALAVSVFNGLLASCIDSEDYIEARKYANMIIHLLDNTDQKLDLVTTLHNVGYLLLLFDECEQSLEVLKKSLVIAESMKAYLIISRIYDKLGLVYSKMKDYEKSIIFHKRSLRLLSKINIFDVDMIVECKHNVVCSLALSGKIKEAIYENSEAESLLRQHKKGNNIQKALNLRNRGKIYFINKDYSNCVYYIKEGLKLGQAGRKIDSAESLMLLGLSLCMLNKTSKSMEILSYAREMYIELLGEGCNSVVVIEKYIKYLNGVLE